ncbi:hypothetical protein [Streptomyces sp. bgisy100]|uniref:hypothetical protein n=1 Tax=Streptomyces sp. bgisy100 TaxID=3413783 RepID=UPI003D75695C
MAGYAFPDDLVTAQQQLDQVRAELSAFLATLPWSVEPAPGFRQTKEDGYWSSRERPESPGWTEDDQARVKELRHRELGLTETVLTHDFWSSLSGPDRVAARTALKHLEAGQKPVGS